MVSLISFLLVFILAIFQTLPANANTLIGLLLFVECLIGIWSLGTISVFAHRKFPFFFMRSNSTKEKSEKSLSLTNSSTIGISNQVAVEVEL